MCTGAIINARIPKVFYGAPDEKAGTCGTLMNLLGDERFNHRASIEKGCLGNECGKLLSDFLLRFVFVENAELRCLGFANELLLCIFKLIFSNFYAKDWKLS